MSKRINLARFLFRLGSFIHSLPIVIMKPDDLVEFSRQTYATPESVEDWAEDVLVDSGLWPEETDLIKSIHDQKGDLLLLGIGGGREAIPFAKMGFKVTGVDFIPGMVEKAIANAEARGYKILGLVQDISSLDVPDTSYDVVWFSRAMYSCVPTRARRIAMLKQIYHALKPGGYLLCQFYSKDKHFEVGKAERLRRTIAKSPVGNREYEKGDTLWLNMEFVHFFTSEAEIRTELEEGGLCVTQIKLNPASIRGAAICKKKHDRT
jgi:SAM-dependent methyltransferase